MDIVDTQLHLGPGPVEPALAEMDALGIKSVLIEEFWIAGQGDGPKDALMPGFRLPGGAWRAVYPTALSASLRYPDRFGYFVRLDRRDPDLEGFMRGVAAEPGARGFRLLATWSAEEVAALESGAYDALFDIAQDVGLPVCIFVPGHVELLPRYLRKYPRLQFVLDHLGIGMPGHPPGRSETDQARTTDPAYLDEVLKLAEFANLAIKISHAPMLLRAGAYPFEAVRHSARLPDDLAGGAQPRRHPVVVVGGGPVGYVAAIGLANQGVPVVLLEADDSVCFGSRAICISRRSLEIAARHGAVDGFLKIGLPWTGGRSFYRDTELLHFLMPQDDNQKLPPMVNLAQYHIEQILLDRCAFSFWLRYDQSTFAAYLPNLSHPEAKQMGRRA